MIYEMRSYEVVPGRLADLHARFEQHTLGFFDKHGIKTVGFWEPVIGTRDTLHYLLAWEDLGHRDRAWDAFVTDPEWLKVRDESQRSGPIVARIRNEIWRPTGYSSLR